MRKLDGQIYRQRDRQADKETDRYRQAGRQVDGQTDRLNGQDAVDSLDRWGR